MNNQMIKKELIKASFAMYPLSYFIISGYMIMLANFFTGETLTAHHVAISFMTSLVLSTMHFIFVEIYKYNKQQFNA